MGNKVKCDSVAFHDGNLCGQERVNCAVPREEELLCFTALNLSQIGLCIPAVLAADHF